MEAPDTCAAGCLDSCSGVGISACVHMSEFRFRLLLQTTGAWRWAESSVSQSVKGDVRLQCNNLNGFF